jgi:hypothetical protein
MQEIIMGKWFKLKVGQKQKISLLFLAHSLQFIGQRKL